MSTERQLSDVTWTRFVIGLTQALSDRMLKWAALFAAVGVTAGGMIRPNPVRAALACLLVGLLSPLWLRRSRDGE